ncbi:MAG: VTT domain-containing protein [Legionellales bacterium]|nr:VTT domain-containing protein [Legionellales bacterium]
MKALSLALVAITMVVCAFFFQRHATAIFTWIDTLGFLAPIFFLILYCLASLLFLPTLILTFAGGALFGPIVGTFLNLLGATIGATSAFCISRFIIFDRLSHHKNMRFNPLMLGVEKRGWQFVALLRLIPILPFHLVNYGLGITRIKFSHYFITTVIFLLPAELVFTYCGYAGMDVLTLMTEKILKLLPKSLFF